MVPSAVGFGIARETVFREAELVVADGILFPVLRAEKTRQVESLERKWLGKKSTNQSDRVRRNIIYKVTTKRWLFDCLSID